MTLSEPEYSPFLGNDTTSNIPFEKYSNLCNCVFCWSYCNVAICNKCNKKYCEDHESNHLCFIEKSTEKFSPILTSKKHFKLMVIKN